eukprot:1482935-Karenia_brevis.AAC.1
MQLSLAIGGTSIFHSKGAWSSAPSHFRTRSIVARGRPSARTLSIRRDHTEVYDFHSGQLL